MLCIFEYHKNAFILQDNLLQFDHVDMAQLCTKSHLTHSRLGDTGVLDLLSFFVRLELFDGEESWLTIFTTGLVNSTVSARGYEAYNFVFVEYADLVFVGDVAGVAVSGFCAGR